MNAADRRSPEPGELYLDHVGHFAADPAAAARLLGDLGFYVSRDGEVVLKTGGLRLLPPAPRCGLGLVAFATPDAPAEQRRAAAHGFADGAMPEGQIHFVQAEACALPIDVPAHPNEVMGLTTVYVAADDPARAAARWAEFAGLLPRSEGGAVRLATACGHVVIAKPALLEEVFGQAPAPGGIAGYALACVSPPAFAARCIAEGLTVFTTATRCAVALPAALGGAWLLEQQE